MPNTIFSVFMQGRGDMSYLRHLRPRVVKIMDGKQEEIDAIRKLTPDTCIINRIFVDDGVVSQAIKADPEGAAEAHHRLIMSKVLSGVDLFQVQNEQHQHPPELALLNRYYMRLMKLAVDAGYRTTVIDCSVGNLHVGRDHPGDWPHVYPTLDYAQQHGFVVNVHQYSRESFWNPAFNSEWYLHRLEQTAMPVLDREGFGSLRYVVGEFGLTNMLGGGSPGGWQKWRSHDEYKSDLINVMSYLIEWSDRILGYCCYLTHAFSPWQTHEMYEMNVALADHYAAHPQQLKPLIEGGGNGSNGGNEPVLYQAKVTANTLNVRSGPAVGGTLQSVVGQVHGGDVVDVLNDGAVWWKIRTAVVEGYSSSRYLQHIDDGVVVPPPNDLAAHVAKLEARVAVLEEGQDTLSDVVAQQVDIIYDLQDRVDALDGGVAPPPPTNAQFSQSVKLLGLKALGSGAYHVAKAWTTHNGSWEPNPKGVFAVPQWARDAYLRSPDHPNYHDDAGGDHHVFARVEDANGRFETDARIVFTRYVGGEPVESEEHTVSAKHGWTNIPITYPAFWRVSVSGSSQEMSEYALPNSAGGMPGKEHVSLFVVFRRG